MAIWQKPEAPKGTKLTSSVLSFLWNLGLFGRCQCKVYNTHSEELGGFYFTKHLYLHGSFVNLFVEVVVLLCN